MSDEGKQAAGQAAWRHLRSLQGLADLLADNGRRVAHRLEFAEGDVARHVFHAAVRRRDQPIRGDVFEAMPDAIGDHGRGLDFRIGEINHAEQDFLGRQIGEHAEIELGLRGLDRDLLGGGIRELGQKGIT